MCVCVHLRVCVCLRICVCVCVYEATRAIELDKRRRNIAGNRVTMKDRRTSSHRLLQMEADRETASSHREVKTVINLNWQQSWAPRRLPGTSVLPMATMTSSQGSPPSGALLHSSHKWTRTNPPGASWVILRGLEEQPGTKWRAAGPPVSFFCVCVCVI